MTVFFLFCEFSPKLLQPREWCKMKNVSYIPEKENENGGGDSLSWQATERGHNNGARGTRLVIIVGAAILAVIAIIQKNFFFLVFLIFSSILFFVLSKRSSRVLNFRVDEKGVAIGDNIFHNYDIFEGFATRETRDGASEIILKRKRKIDPFLRIPIETAIVKKTEEVLKKKLPFIIYEISLMDVLDDVVGV